METINSYLPELLAFHEVALQGSFTKAAEKLTISKAQLSKQVARLETGLKAQLFHRTTRSLTLTEEGKHLLQYSAGIVKLSSEAAASMKELVDQEGGLIRITAPSSLADWFAPELLTLFKEKLPHVKVEIESSNLKRDLIQDGYDFALRAMDESNLDLIARYLGHIKDVIVASPDYVKKSKLKGLNPEELKGVPVLLSSLKQNWNTWKLQKGERDFVFDVQGNYASTSYQTNRQMSLAGLGIARVPFYLVEKALTEKRLVHLYRDYTITTHPLYLVYPSQGYRARKQKLARDLILEWMKKRKGIFQ